MNSDSHAQDVLAEYADAAKSIHASQRFRAETLRKIRMADAMQPRQESKQTRAEEDEPAVLVQTKQPAKPISHAESSKKARLQSFLATAAAFVLVSGTAVMLYQKAKEQQSVTPSPNSTASSAASNAAAPSYAKSLLEDYQSTRSQLANQFAQAEPLFNRLFAAMNPPTPESMEVLTATETALSPMQQSYLQLESQRQKQVDALCQADDVILYDAVYHADGKLELCIANGTDETITVSRGCSLVEVSKNQPISGKIPSLDRNGTELMPHSVGMLTMEGISQNLSAEKQYCLTLFNCGFRYDGTDGGSRSIVFSAVDSGQNLPEMMLASETWRNYSLETNKPTSHPQLEVLEKLNAKERIQALQECIPAYRFTSEVCTFSPQIRTSGTLDNGLREIWYLTDDGTAFAECLNGEEYHFYCLNATNGTINELFLAP